MFSVSTHLSNTRLLILWHLSDTLRPYFSRDGAKGLDSREKIFKIVCVTGLTLSGTGKTSLPKVFCEALLGEICVVPVESSWRDRNELLGYYNDFSKKFTAKEFTCDLYRAGCERYNDTLFFIVLDEMNLSRVEYYFADFLSVLEDKKENWDIRLVDTDMRQLPTEITDEVIRAIEKDQSEAAREGR